MLTKLAALSQKSALLIGVVVGGFYYMWGFDDGSKIKIQLNKAKDVLAKEKAVRAQSEAVMQEFGKQKEAFLNLESQYQMASQELPTDIGISEVLKSIDKLSEMTGVTVKSKEQGRTILRKETQLELVPFTVVLEGGFSSLVQFLYYVSTLERVIRVKDFKISDESTKSPSNYKGKVNLKVELLAFRMNVEKVP
jgi:Tfp pilus assembly protein PilO